MLSLTAVILTKNEARQISACIASLQEWVEAVVVWDSGSEDATQHLAQKAGAHVVVRPFDDYAQQRQAALNSIRSEWILFIDADERATPALAQEIIRAVMNTQYAGYWIPRRNFIVGHEMQGGGFRPDYQLRLLRSSAARYDLGRKVHEIVALNGPQGHLQAALLHYNYDDWSQFQRKQRSYARYEATILAERGVRPRLHHFILQPIRELRRRFVTLQGWRDGVHGLRVTLLLAWYYGFLPYWLLWKAQRDQ